MFILFDSVVIGELLLWNAYLAYVMIFGLQMNDFGKFYYSAVDWLKGGRMYGPSPATLLQLDGGRLQHFWNLNPPHFHIFLLPLALLPPIPAMALWGVANLACLVLSWILVAKEIRFDLRGPWRWRLAVIGALTFAGTGATLLTGQLTFLLLIIVTICWLNARRGRWSRAGLFLGVALSLKPFLLVFVPYLALKRQFRALSMCALTVALCFGTGLLVFGPDVHLDWLRAIAASSDWTWAGMNASVLGFLSRCLTPGPHFSPLAVAPWLVQPIWILAAGVIFILTIATSLLDPRTCSVDRDFALMLLAALLISPLGWVYYLWLPLGPFIGILVSSWQAGTGERFAIRSGPTAWRNRLFWAGLIALTIPPPVVDLIEHNPWATASLGSSYFWGALVLWASLFLDWSALARFRDGMCRRGVVVE